MPVRKWLKGDIDYEELEASYLKSQMLFYKIGEDLMENLSVNEHKENEAVSAPGEGADQLFAFSAHPPSPCR